MCDSEFVTALKLKQQYKARFNKTLNKLIEVVVWNQKQRLLSASEMKGNARFSKLTTRQESAAMLVGMRLYLDTAVP